MKTNCSKHPTMTETLLNYQQRRKASQSRESEPSRATEKSFPTRKNARNVTKRSWAGIYNDREVNKLRGHNRDPLKNQKLVIYSHPEKAIKANQLWPITMPGLMALSLSFPIYSFLSPTTAPLHKTLRIRANSRGKGPVRSATTLSRRYSVRLPSLSSIK